MYARDHALIATPIGPIRIEGDESHVLRVSIGVAGTPQRGSTAPVREAARQISAYISGDLKDFDLPLPAIASPRGYALRAGLVAIPYGGTMSYGALAHELDSGARAIGQLCARNPLPIIVPCHRVLAASGALGAYSAGDGPVTKQWLLEHERRNR